MTDVDGSAVMRIDSGPTFDEIRDSVKNGKIVTFRSLRREEVRGVAVDAKVDLEKGRAALMVEEQTTGAVYFSRYSHPSGLWSCGEPVSWHLMRDAIQELRRET